MDIQFEWDDVKAQANIIKHKVSFEEAATIFQDPFLITFFDDTHSDKEDRFISIGDSDQKRLLLVIHTEQEDAIRIISARSATRKERATYEQRA